MKVVIVAKTRMGTGACVGGVTFDGRSVRLIPIDKEFDEQFNHEYEIGDVWDISYTEDPASTPPHLENIIVQEKRKLPPIDDITAFIEQKMPPHCGGAEILFEGLAQTTGTGVQYIAKRTGIPPYSTMFWRPDRPLSFCDDAKRIRYLYPIDHGGRTLTFVGYQEPIKEIPAGTLLRVSLAHWWRPGSMPEGEFRCYVQLSGWFIDTRKFQIHFQNPDRSTVAKSGSHQNIEEAQRLLEQVFGHDSFRPMQKEVIENVLKKRDSLVVMPTGSGKSICYQLPALMFPGLTVVVSPLISLMQDQVEQLRQHGIHAEFLNSTLGYSDYIRTTSQIRAGKVRLLYAAPETLLKPETILLLQQIRVDCLTIDEAHCISQWGHDFRSEYRQLITILNRLPLATCVAVTATATERVRKDIKQTLHIMDADEFVASFNRENLFLAVEQKTGRKDQILEFLKNHKKEAGIIYCNTKREVDELVEELTNLGWPVLPYHADLENELRERNQRRFTFGEGLIVVATIAFGMGIDKSNVRFIVHYGLPKNLENYYQQIGRAGRDGLRADCLLLYSSQDISTIQYFINQQDESQKVGAWARLKTILAYAETSNCRRRPLLAYFGEDFEEAPCDFCDNCLANQDIEKDDITLPAQMFLSCVLRTGQFFGKAHIIKVLRGSRAKSVLSRKHDQLSTYNIGREFSKSQWGDLADQFLRLGLLQNDVQYGSLRITKEGKKVLHGKKLYGHMPTGGQSKSTHKLWDHTKDYDLELFDWLRTKRSELALKANVPPYLIFSDYSLSEMAYYFPQSKDAFANINGVGNFKLEKYADDFLPIICAYCQEKNIHEKPTRARRRRQRKQSVTNLSRTKVIADTFNSGVSLKDIANEHGIKERTVIGHLWKHFKRGGRLDSKQLLTLSGLEECDRQRVFEVMTDMGVEFLRPIYDYFDGSISYDELRIMRLYFITSHIDK